MKKKILCLVMMMVLVFSLSTTALAEDYRGTAGWQVSFDGKKMNTNFASADMTKDVLSILPGDSITLEIALENVADKKTDWYMTNEVLQTLEDSNSSAQGGAYTYILTYLDPAGKETVLYSSEVVGGDTAARAQQEQGLHQASDRLEDFFYLDRLEKGEKSSVRLYVQLDGETQGNAYQDTLAKLQMNFAVEPIHEGTITTYVEKEVIVYTPGINTGDNNPVVLLSAAALVSGLALLILAVVKMRKRNAEKGGQP